ncbi:MAG: MauE/DoxX family redox-associated membrane protein [Streptosporangiaceae bacterium]
MATLLLGACVTKLVRIVQTSSVDAGFGPTALFLSRLRRPVAVSVCAIEGGLGLGLILTAGQTGAPAICLRLGARLLFLVATSALIELRAPRPDVGCGCCGDFSSAPVSRRTLARSALLAAAALSTVSLHRLQQPKSGGEALRLLAILGAHQTHLSPAAPTARLPRPPDGMRFSSCL